MEIREIRNALQKSDNLNSFHTAPDWAVRHIFEKRNGMPLSRTGRPVETRSAAQVIGKRKPAVTAPAISAAEREQMKRRVELSKL
jgi:hypothetical protein